MRDDHADARGFWPTSYRLLRLAQPTWVIALLSLLLFATLLTPQSGEVLAAAAGPASEDGVPLLAVYLGTTLFAVSSWYSARILLYMDYRRKGAVARVPARGARKRSGQAVRRIVPRIYGVLPFAAVAIGFAKAEEWWNLFAVCVAAGAFTGFVVVRRRFLHERGMDWVQRLSCASIFGAVGVLALNGAVFFFLLISPVEGARSIGAAGILLLFFSGWIVLGSTLVHVGYRVFYRRWRPRSTPFVLLLLATLAAGAFWRDNHPIRTVDCEEQPCAQWQELSIDDHFDVWLSRRRAGQTPVPVVLVAAEGGGIRAAFWTASVLGKLSEEIPGFACHVYAVSGASGGSIGAAIWVARLAETLEPDACARDTETRGLVAPAQRVFSQDLLSPVIGALLTRDLVGHFVPASVLQHLWEDRAAVFEGGIEEAWTRRHGPEPTDEHALSREFRALWGIHEPRYDLPSLFVNASREETGGPATISNLSWKIPGGAMVARPGAYPLRRRMAGQVSISTAIHAGARFPVVSPAGTVWCPDGVAPDDAECQGRPGEVWDQISDGGYFENSGAFTALDVRRRIQARCGGQCRFVHIAISNDPRHPALGARRRDSRFGLNPINTVLRGRSAWRTFAEQRFLGAPDTESFHVGLEPQPGRADPALGWLLHETSQTFMSEQTETKVPVEAVRRAFEARPVDQEERTCG